MVVGGDIQVRAGYLPTEDDLPTSASVFGETVALPAEVDSQIVSVTVGGAAADQFALGGSVSINVVAHDIDAHISGTRSVTADGSILVAAADDLVMTSVAGGVALGQNAVGAGVSLQIAKNKVTAYIGADAVVDARGNGSGILAPTGTKDGSGNLQTTLVKGLAVTATSFEDVVTVSIGGAAAARAAVAGGASVTVLNQTTSAYVGENAAVNTGTSGEGSDQSVVVLASDDTELVGVGGALALGGTAGVGAGIDVIVLTKTTEAHVASGADLEAQRDVLVQAFSFENVTSVSVAGAAGIDAGVAGGVDVSVLTITTRAYLEGVKTGFTAAAVAAGGSVVVSAEGRSEVDVVAGSLAIGGTAGIGGALGIPIVTKTTEAYVGNGVAVDAYATIGFCLHGDAIRSGPRHTCRWVEHVIRASVNAVEKDNCITGINSGPDRRGLTRSPFCAWGRYCCAVGHVVR